MTKILISLNGDCTAEKNQLREDYDLIFGVDGGTEYLYKLLLVPTHIIGDFDSIKEATKNRAERDGAKILTFSKEKKSNGFRNCFRNSKRIHGRFNNDHWWRR
jgi:thiamine pyrophosphokinase